MLAYPVLQGAAGARIEAFRRRHEPARAALVAAHVTLVFGVDGIDGTALADHAAACAAASAPIDLQLDRMQDFADPGGDGFKLFLMVGQGREQLAALHLALYGGALAARHRADLPFEPHVTIASCTDRQARDRARGECAILTLPLAGRIDAIEVASLERDSLRRIALVPLGGHAGFSPAI